MGVITTWFRQIKRRIFRRRTLVGWIVTIFTVLWANADRLSTVQSLVRWWTDAQPYLLKILNWIVGIDRFWYQMVLLVIGLAWIAIVASRPETTPISLAKVILETKVIRAEETAKRQELERARQFLGIAESDDSNMTRRIHYLTEYSRAHAHLTEHSPYIDLEFAFDNASVFDVTFSRTVGRIAYAGTPLESALTLPGQVASPSAFPPPIVIRHGERSGFTLRQWVPARAADQMSNEVLNTGNAVLDIRPIALCFTYTNHMGQPKEVCVGIPGSYSITRSA